MLRELHVPLVLRTLQVYLTRAEQRSRATSLDLRVVPFLMQPRTALTSVHLPLLDFRRFSPFHDDLRGALFPLSRTGAGGGAGGPPARQGARRRRAAEPLYFRAGGRMAGSGGAAGPAAARELLDVGRRPGKSGIGVQPVGARLGQAARSGSPSSSGCW